MFGRKRWKNVVLIEGTKEAMLVAQKESLPDVNRDFDSYPVDVALPKRRNFIQALQKALWYSKKGVYNIFYKV